MNDCDASFIIFRKMIEELTVMWWFSLDTPVSSTNKTDQSSTNKTDRHDIAEI
jgi:hypothetical protein